MGKLFYIMGKSATGKDHVYRALLEDEALHLAPLVLYTTRPMREKERDGREYYFVDEGKLAQLRASGCLIEERVYHTVRGDWYYFTADEGQIDLSRQDYLGIGTLESWEKVRDHFGIGRVVPLYIETDDGIRLRRAIRREEKQERPDYQELCRRFLADSADFSDERLREAGIGARYANNDELADCIGRIREAVRNAQAGE